MRSLQLSQTSALGVYDPMIPVPFPYTIEEDGKVADQHFWKGDPYSFIGFQNLSHRHQVDVFVKDWMEADPDSVVGKYAVFSDESGIYVDKRPVERVIVF